MKDANNVFDVAVVRIIHNRQNHNSPWGFFAAFEQKFDCLFTFLLQMVDFRMRNLNISIYNVVYINGKIKLLLGMFTHFCSCGFLDKQYHFTVYVGKCKFSPFLISRRVFKALSNMYAKLFYENSEKLSGHQPITIFVKKLHRSCFIES